MVSLAWTVMIMSICAAIGSVILGLTGEKFSFFETELNLWGDYIGGVLGGFATIILACTVILQARAIGETNKNVTRSFIIAASPQIINSFSRSLYGASVQSALIQDNIDPENVITETRIILLGVDGAQYAEHLRRYVSSEEIHAIQRIIEEVSSTDQSISVIYRDVIDIIERIRSPNVP